MRSLPAAVLAACLLFFIVAIFHQTGPNGVAPAPASAAEAESGKLESAPLRLQGAQAREYVEKTEDGRSLAQAVTAARFGLKWQEKSPFESTTNLSLSNGSGGYLGMSHVQNLNAWFDDEGVTIRPTLPEEESAKAWRLGMKLKAYGYGAQVIEAPPIVSHTVKENRIEYERSDCRFSIANCRFENLGSLNSNSDTTLSDTTLLPSIRQSAIGNRQSAMIEWYENRAAGIEQGFMLNAPPERKGVDKGEPLRLVVALEGDLRARAKPDGSQLELFDQRGDSVLSYGQLSAKDATGRILRARMETNAEGREIALVVEDKGATYPIEIDPITATLEQKLTAPSPQPGAEFGDAVAISGNVAVLGAFREDNISAFDVGRVYIFTRNGSTWTFKYSTSLGTPSAQCGWSVAVSGNDLNSRVAFGCPGSNSNTGFVEMLSTGDGWSTATGTSVTPPGPNPGDRYGESVAVDYSYNQVFVGAPFTNNAFLHTGVVWLLTLDNNLNITKTIEFGTNEPEAHCGTSLAQSRDRLIVGAPGAGKVAISSRSQSDPAVWLLGNFTLSPNDGAPGDVFGYSVGISGNMAVVGAPLNDNAKGTDAGAAYVFALDSNGNWIQQQKLIASDGIDQDQFGESVAIEGNTIVVGSPYNGSKSFTGIRRNGRTYVFMWNINTWVEQTIISALFDGAPRDQFGINIAFSFDTVISGAEHATVGNTSDAGAAYIHRLSCVPPAFSRAFTGEPFNPQASAAICPGSSLPIFLSVINYTGAPLSYQWRRNGVNIAGATASNYTVNNAGAADAGSYDAIISDSCGAEISTPFTLVVFSFSVFPARQNIGFAGNTGLLAVNATGSSCPWTARSNASWITVTSGSPGTGSGNVGFRVDPNPSSTQRIGTMTVAGQTITFTQDANPSPVVQFSSSNYSVTEACTTVTITVNRIGDASGAAKVDYTTSDVTATARRDYITAMGTLSFAAGETSKSFVVLINDDSYVEGAETFNVNLSNPAGIGLGAPAIATVTIFDNATEPGANVIDDPGDFVCQHYHDFLNRQPDASGLAFWTNEITSCGADQACIETKRINVSAAFYLSIEFQATGYLVERIYKAAYGDGNGTSTFGGTHQLSVPVIRLNEFLPDTQEIGQGVVVGQGNWQQQLDDNKNGFTSEFVQRSRFTTAFPNSMTAAQFVDKLNQNAGNPLSQSERDQLVTNLTSGSKTRAQALRAIAEDQDLNNSEFNRAFVLMQYFGYLRRNPNDPQDSDYTGYDFWLTKLNQFSGNFINAEMVKAFIVSGEYRNRFGP